MKRKLVSYNRNIILVNNEFSRLCIVLKKRSVLAVEEILQKQRVVILCNLVSQWKQTAIEERDNERMKNALADQKKEQEDLREELRKDLTHQLEVSKNETATMEEEKKQVEKTLQNTINVLNETKEKKENVEKELEEKKKEIESHLKKIAELEKKIAELTDALEKSKKSDEEGRAMLAST